MKPIEFPQQTMILAKDQPEYQPLPVFRDAHGHTVSCWRLSLWERIKLLYRGRIWLMQLTFNQPLQPQLPLLESPFDTPQAQDKPEPEPEEEPMSRSSNWIDLGSELEELAEDQAEWSQATFGTDKERGPIGALRHLAKEAEEAEKAVTMNVHIGGDHSAVAEEFADCLLLLLDASRRARITPLQLVRAAEAKMVKNKARQWPKPTTDEPVEHVRG